MTQEELLRQGLTEEQAAYVMGAWEDQVRREAVRAAMEGYVFSSLAARDSVQRRVMEAELPLEDGRLQGLGELMESIRQEDPEAFWTDEPPVRFTVPMSPDQAPTREQIIKIPDRARRRAAIAENMRLFKGED